MRLPAVKSLALATLGAAVLALGASTAAVAGPTPCWRALINDWFDGRIDQTYPIGCYQDAISHLPRDVDTYSSAKEDIQRAMLAQIRSGRGEKPTWTLGSDGKSGGSGGGSKSIIYRAIEWLGPSNAGAVPLPLLILAGVAFLLLAAAGGSYVSRWLQQRRLPPPPQP
jgi:hypothetical protein